MYRAKKGHEKKEHVVGKVVLKYLDFYKCSKVLPKPLLYHPTQFLYSKYGLMGCDNGAPNPLITTDGGYHINFYCFLHRRPLIPYNIRS